MTQELVRSFEAEIDSVLEGERAVVARINTAAVDRLRTVIDPLGGNTAHFNKTASVLWQHGMDQVRGTLPIGSGWVKVRKTERDMLGKTKFAKDDFSQQLFEAYKEGTLRGWSIKAGVQHATPPTVDEIRSRPELSDCEMIYRKWDLIEYSGTPTPGNSDCLTLLVSRGLITAPEGFVPVESAKGLQAVIENVPELVKAMIRAEPYIEQADELYRVYARDGSLVASLPDEVSAQECLRLLNGGPSFDQQVMGLIGELHASRAAMAADVQAYVDLWRHGRV